MKPGRVGPQSARVEFHRALVHEHVRAAHDRGGDRGGAGAVEGDAAEERARSDNLLAERLGPLESDIAGAVVDDPAGAGRRVGARVGHRRLDRDARGVDRVDDHVFTARAGHARDLAARDHDRIGAAEEQPVGGIEAAAGVGDGPGGAARVGDLEGVAGVAGDRLVGGEVEPDIVVRRGGIVGRPACDGGLFRRGVQESHAGRGLVGGEARTIARGRGIGEGALEHRGLRRAERGGAAAHGVQVARRARRGSRREHDRRHASRTGARAEIRAAVEHRGPVEVRRRAAHGKEAAVADRAEGQRGRLGGVGLDGEGVDAAAAGRLIGIGGRRAWGDHAEEQGTGVGLGPRGGHARARDRKLAVLDREIGVGVGRVDPADKRAHLAGRAEREFAAVHAHEHRVDDERIHLVRAGQELRAGAVFEEPHGIRRRRARGADVAGERVDV